MPQNSLPFRRAPRAGRWWCAPVVAAPKLDAAQGRARIYVCELDARADARIICASLEAAGLPPPRWLPGTRTGADEEEVRAAFLAGEPVAVPLAPPPAGPDRLARLLAWAQKADVEVDLVPVEVLWGPERTRVRLRDLWLGNPFAPPRWLRWLHVRRPGRCRVLAAAPATRSELESHTPRSLAAFARSRALRALSRQEREIFGERLKVARFLVEEILAEPDFQDRIAAAGAISGLARPEALRRAELALRELAGGQRRLALASAARLARWLTRLGFEPDPSVDPGQIARLRELGRHASLVFLPSRQSPLDLLVLFEALFTAGLAPPFLAAGTGTAPWPLGRLLRATGAFFVRRDGDDPLYHEVLRAFVSHLVQRHFHLGFCLEDAPTRSGKLRPPRHELLRHTLEAGRPQGASEVWLVPASLSYEPVLATGDVHGHASLRALLQRIRRARRERPGRIHLRFADPLSLRTYLAHHDAERLRVEKLAFAICTGINASKPLLPAALVCSILLGNPRRALTGPELESEVEHTIDWARERGIELGAELGLGAAEAVGAALASLRGTGVVTSYAGGLEPVFFVADDQRSAADYQRNTIVHWFLGRAIAQLALAAAELGAASESDWALRLRELLKFEFFFSERDRYLSELDREQSLLEAERARGSAPFAAGSPRILGELLEGYQVVAETLTSRPPPDAGATDVPALPEAELLERCRGLERQLRLQDRIDRPESLSDPLFANALQLLANLGAIERGADGIRLCDRAELESLASDLERLVSLARRR